jgi:isoleucyl-tRNA synthetase
MSKSLGNVIAPQEIMNKHGAEILRLWVAAEDYREDVRISDEILSRLVEAYRKLRNTARFLISNLYDFDPDRDRITPENLMELDLWILHRTHNLLARCREAYEEFEFHVVYHALNNFCSVDLSALYLDIVKDRLYCEAATSKQRKSAQTVLYSILEALVHLMAPILSFTTEEIWEYMPKKNGAPESIFLSTLPTPDPALMDERLAASLNQVLRARDEILKALEKSRKPSHGENVIGHIIGHSLDAEVLIYPDMYDSGLKAIFGAHEARAWEDILIVSKVKLERGETPFQFDWERAKNMRKTIGQAGSFSIIHVDGREGRMYDSPLFNGPVVIFKATGQKCERCWKYSEDVGKDARYPTVCQRCAGVLGSRGSP